ncbi:beta-L-arabinofuranosidase domain-containing protein [Flavihumibacter profundi]|uniref:beta-L-arabinofuranosidase domain-containing protein n=1 Tax=Flavihumibacter profundi TaxID=2716883 RepID=UPI001CC44CF9|nr:beta-L-arabinofuranosidase domain-containing protein [Flavihumibacter profundi]MBZ5855616.1 glycoside hydrolase family 127 protein [Flavihumibacter profundi]
MKYRVIQYLALITICYCSLFSQAQSNPYYITNQAPLQPQAYVALPLGSIQPKGWLLKMLELQRAGLTSNLDSVYKEVCGPANAWLGGNGDAWERGPYWLDGLVPLAYILNDQQLKDKAQQWIEWSIANQREDGYFGPRPPTKPLPSVKGVQNTDHEDWWPKMVMLKVLQQYYSATEDKRVLKLMSGYFKYMLLHLPQQPLDHWTFWGAQRGGDNLAVVYWLYNITKEPFLIELGDLIYKQTTPWKSIFTDGTLATVNPFPQLHCVNVAQGIKTPVIYYQRTGDSSYLASVKTGLETIRKVHGFANGMYGADESMHGNDPTQGSELCSAVEMMFSFESMLPITGDVAYADYLEKIAFNVLPAQHNDKFTLRQYFQQPNQIKVTYDHRNFFDDIDGRLVFGVLTGYPCCTANMHQGYPKYVQNLWYATADEGVAALVYGSSDVKLKVRGGNTISFTEETNYPFDDHIKFTYTTNQSVSMPFHLRIPAWCKKAVIRVNGEIIEQPAGNQVIVINRTWKKGDILDLQLPMEIHTSRWAENSIAIERGPLLYALKIEEEWKSGKNNDFPQAFYEVLPKSPWNYGITDESVRKSQFKITEKKTVADMPWNLQNAPISITVKGKRLMQWKEYNNSAGKLPISRAASNGAPEELITLIPYGCTTLRISEFPLTD